MGWRGWSQRQRLGIVGCDGAGWDVCGGPRENGMRWDGDKGCGEVVVVEMMVDFG